MRMRVCVIKSSRNMWPYYFILVLAITIPVTIVHGQLNTFSDHYYNTRKNTFTNTNSDGRNGNVNNPSQSYDRDRDHLSDNNSRQNSDQYNNYNYNYDRGGGQSQLSNEQYRGQYINQQQSNSQQDYGKSNSGDYYANDTHRIRGNISDYYVPNVYGNSNRGNSVGSSNNPNLGVGANSNIGDWDSRQRNYVTQQSFVQDGGQARGNNNYGSSGQNPGQGFNDNKVNIINENERRDSGRSASINLPETNKDFIGPVQYNYPSSGTLQQQHKEQGQGQGFSGNWGTSDNRGGSTNNGNSDFQGNSGFQGRPGYEGSHSFGAGYPRSQNTSSRDQSTSNSQNPYNRNQQTNRPSPEIPSYGSNYQSGYSGGGGSYNSRGVFDPGYPNRNIWNEHWSTTTLRPTAPGVLGKWRPDLQGQQRPEDVHQVPQSVYATTSFGRVQGFKVKLYDGPWVPLPARPGVTNVDKVKAYVSSFVGIPYARSPALEGRFRPPRAHTGWQLHQAVEFGPACPQPSRFFGYQEGIIQVDEDCLYLNVYSPDVGSGVEGSPYPVIFYIHDGDFVHGGSQTFPPHQLVAWYKLVVVTVNFRLGSLGFLSTADEFSPGNYGMLDLSLALKWVHSNIRSFNGDPNRITLLGLGSGAAAAGLLMLVPRTKLFVKNVIALDGAPTADWAAITDKYRLQNTTQLYSFKMGCWNEYDTTSWSMVQCLRTRSWQELANLELDPDVGTFAWSPAVDRTFKVPMDDYLHDWKEEDWRFLPDSPENILRSGDYPQVKYLAGYSRQSAADILFNNKTMAPRYEVTREWFDEQINLWVKKYNYTLNPEGVFNAIRYAYTYWPDPLNRTHLREEFIQFMSDALYRAPVDQTIKLLLARGVQVHTYLLNYTLEGLRLPEWRSINRGLNYYMLCGAPFMDPEFLPERLRLDRSTWTEGDRNMSLFLMTAVANMSYYGNPTHEEILGLYWERSTPADLKYFSLNGTNNSTMDRNYRQRELTFWTEYMPYVIGKYVPTYPPTTEYWWEPNEPLQIAFWTVSGICLILIVVLVSCCLLWRNAKMQRDRIYDDLRNTAPNIGTIVGDEISEYAETEKTIDSMDSTIKIPAHNKNPPIDLRLYSPQIHTNQGAISHPSLAPSKDRDRDRFPTPKRTTRERDTGFTVQHKFEPMKPVPRSAYANYGSFMRSSKY